ncbi:hypothetical protein [Neobacillus sp. PS3-40]|uniref:hypothetical protein n=1 Tax=Neobacillus sp. PS3-40 TaxID=3070679 RepID=UPI0027E08C3B|nr:hypothetical protein [Neobacillus sp. PS3-40]WML44379.1 hypothetical protein RCG20_00205 [Neobacillus sp. PS3-40]
MTLIMSILAGIITVIIVLLGTVNLTNNMESDSAVLFAISVLCGIVVACTIAIIDTIKRNTSPKK